MIVYVGIALFVAFLIWVLLTEANAASRTVRDVDVPYLLHFGWEVDRIDPDVIYDDRGRRWVITETEDD